MSVPHNGPPQPQLQIPQQMVQQLLRGPMPAQQPPDVVEVECEDDARVGFRVCFNMDAVEKVMEGEDDSTTCSLKLKGDDHWFTVRMTYDEFLHAAKVQPRQLYAQANTGD